MKKRLSCILILMVLTVIISIPYRQVSAAEDIADKETVQSEESADNEAVQEETKQEEPQQEETQQEESKQEETLQEETKQEEPQQEEGKQEEPQQEETEQKETEQEETKQEEPVEEEKEDLKAPSLTAQNLASPIACNNEAVIYNNAEFSFKVSDNCDPKDLKFNIKGLPSGAKAEEEINILDEDNAVQYIVKFPDGIYSNETYIEVTDASENTAEYRVFEAARNIIDTKEPVFEISAVKGRNKIKYEGGITNQQIEINIKAEALSGIKKFEMAFLQTGADADDLIWEAVELDGDRYNIKIGADLDETDSFDKDAKTMELTMKRADEDTTWENNDKNAQELVIKKGTYYFRALSYAQLQGESKTDINLQQRNIVIGKTYTDRDTGENGWYNMETQIPNIWVDMPENIVLSDKDEGYTLNVHARVYRDAQEEEEPLYSADKTFEINRQSIESMKGQGGIKAMENIYADEDGCYILYVWGNDEAGNYSATRKYLIKADYTAPENVNISVDGSDMTIDINDKSVTYKKYFNEAVTAQVSGDDALSGIDDDKTVLRIMRSDGEGHSLTGENTISVNACQRCYINAEIYDMAGNCTKARTDGFVVDNEIPWLEIGAVGANENGFFNSDFEIKLSAKDDPQQSNNSAFQNIHYFISDCMDNSYEDNIFTFNAAGADDDALNAAGAFDKTMNIKASDYEGNDTFVELTAVDNSGNTASVKEKFKIDVTAPFIKTEFDNNSAKGGSYYNASRTATVTITEKNFSPHGVEFEITKNGNIITELTPTPESWQSDEDIHTTVIRFSEDGDYTVKIKCSDLAGNESICDDISAFTIDTTLPQVVVLYDASPKNGDYYNSHIQADIMVVEHNFNEEDFVFLSDFDTAAEEWRHMGDIHRTRVLFDNDGEYAYFIDYTDMAGNNIEAPKQDHFIIDTKLPHIAINGIKNNSANSGEISPIINITDENYDAETFSITMTDGSGKTIELENSISQIENGFSYHILNASKQEDSVYHLNVSASDLAGNTDTLDYRFSLNRNGSSYDISSAGPVTEQMYNKYSNIRDIKIIETNIDEIEKFSIYMNRNGEMIDGTQTSVKPTRFKKNRLYYTVDKQGSQELGYTYEYTLFKENFQEEGSYKITFGSVDKAGNRVNNTFDDKQAQLEFIVDDTAPSVYIDGVESDGLYDVENISVNVYVTDNFKLKDAEFYLENKNGVRSASWNYMKLAGDDEKGITLTIPAAEEKQSLLFYAKDYAGNEVIVLPDNEEVPKDFMVGTYHEKTRIYTAVWVITAVSAALMALYLIYRIKVKKAEKL